MSASKHCQQKLISWSVVPLACVVHPYCDADADPRSHDTTESKRLHSRTATLFSSLPIVDYQAVFNICLGMYVCGRYIYYIHKILKRIGTDHQQRRTHSPARCRSSGQFSLKPCSRSCWSSDQGFLHSQWTWYYGSTQEKNLHTKFMWTRPLHT